MTESPISSVPEFTDRLGPALVPLTDKPFVFFGHSMGSILSFEACVWLRRRGLNLPQHLFVSGRRAPHIVDPENIHTKSDEEFLDEIAKLKGTPESVLQNRELLRLLLPSLRSDFTLCETYRYVQDRPLPLPITAFGGLEDDETHHGRLEAWQQHTSVQFTSHRIPGDHFFIHCQEETLLSAMRSYLRDIVLEISGSKTFSGCGQKSLVTDKLVIAAMPHYDPSSHCPSTQEVGEAKSQLKLDKTQETPVSFVAERFQKRSLSGGSQG
jgi:medium-chain acyl-[acyl-carrier-protein] hydrolase